jgi:hypothetical protein
MGKIMEKSDLEYFLVLEKEANSGSRGDGNSCAGQAVPQPHSNQGYFPKNASFKTKC